MATQKDYVATAKVLYQVRHSYLPHWNANLRRACDDHVKAVADMYAAERPQFDRARFYASAGFGESGL